MPAFDELLIKVAEGKKLDPQELESFRQEARALESVKTLINSFVRPGTTTLIVPELRTPGEDLIIDELGMFLKNNQEAALTFGDVNNARGYIFISSTLSNSLQIVNASPTNNAGVFLAILLDGESAALPFWVRPDTTDADRVLITQHGGDNGVRMLLLDKVGIARIGFLGAGQVGGSSYIHLTGGHAAPMPTPPEPANNSNYSEVHAYVKQGKFILQYNDAGTVRYKYLDLTGTGVTWVHTTTAP